MEGVFGKKFDTHQDFLADWMWIRVTLCIFAEITAKTNGAAMNVGAPYIHVELTTFRSCHALKSSCGAIFGDKSEDFTVRRSCLFECSADRHYHGVFVHTSQGSSNFCDNVVRCCPSQRRGLNYVILLYGDIIADENNITKNSPLAYHILYFYGHKPTPVTSKFNSITENNADQIIWLNSPFEDLRKYTLTDWNVLNNTANGRKTSLFYLQSVIARVERCAINGNTHTKLFSKEGRYEGNFDGSFFCDNGFSDPWKRNRCTAPISLQLRGLGDCEITDSLFV